MTTYWLSLGTRFQHNVGIPMGTNCAPLLADLLISVFVPAKTYFILGHITKNGKKLAKSLGLQQTKSNAMDAGTIYPSGAPEITSIPSGVCVVRSVVSR